MLGGYVSLVLSARCPFFSEERGKPSAYDSVKKRQTTIYECVLQLEVCLCANVADVTVSSKLCNQRKFLTNTLEERRNILLQPNLKYG